MFQKRASMLLIGVPFFCGDVQAAADGFPDKHRLVNVYVPACEQAFKLSSDRFITGGLLMISHGDVVCETKTETVVGRFDEKGTLCKEPLWKKMLPDQKSAESAARNLSKWHELITTKPHMETLFALHLKARHLWYVDILSRKEGGTMYLYEFCEQLVSRQLCYIHEIAMVMKTMGWNMGEFYKNLFGQEPKSPHWFAHMHEGSYYACHADGEHAKKVLHEVNQQLIEAFPTLLAPAIDPATIVSSAPSQSSSLCSVQ